MRMLIGELSRRTGLSRDTIRFYEKEDLIAPAKPGRKGILSNNYKDYPESVVGALAFIHGTKALGFTLAEIRDLLELRFLKGFGTRHWAAKAEGKLAEINHKIAELSSLKAVLSEALARCNDQCLDEGCEVLDAAVARQSKTGAQRIHANRTERKGGCCV
jgi:DNA-binding transcriptional MerR regulator